MSYSLLDLDIYSPINFNPTPELSASAIPPQLAILRTYPTRMRSTKFTFSRREYFEIYYFALCLWTLRE